VAVVKAEPKATLRSQTVLAATGAVAFLVALVGVRHSTLLMVAQEFLVAAAVAAPVQVALVALVALAILKFGSILNEISKN
jgi:hypothetical protein